MFTVVNVLVGEFMSDESVAVLVSNLSSVPVRSSKMCRSMSEER
jgi:hypothetical protein